MEQPMRKVSILLAFGAAIATAPALAMSESECAIAWKNADVNNDGNITEAEASRVFAALRIAEVSIPDDRLTRDAYMEHCTAGVFETARRDPDVPVPGANSFTERQAKSRITAAGFTDVSPLRKDDSGIWRGTAMDGSKPISIAVDFKGNVVAK